MAGMAGGREGSVHRHPEVEEKSGSGVAETGAYCVCV